MIESFYDDETSRPVEKPHTFDELAKLTRDERRQLMRQLEEARGADPFNAAAWRAQQRAPMPEP